MNFAVDSLILLLHICNLPVVRAIIMILQCCARNVTPDLTVITYVICLSKVQRSTALYKFEIWAYKPCFIHFEFNTLITYMILLVI